MSGYVPDQRPRLQKATRFFARPQRFTLECPHCGLVYICNSNAPKQAAHWERNTSTFRCLGETGCERAYLIGIVAWPVSSRAHIKGKPRDQVPGPRELAQLRAEGGGWWMPDSEKQRYQVVHESNITTEMERPEKEDDDD